MFLRSLSLDLRNKCFAPGRIAVSSCKVQNTDGVLENYQIANPSMNWPVIFLYAGFFACDILNRFLFHS